MQLKNIKFKMPKRKALITLCVVLSVVLVILIAVTAYAESLLGLINRNTNEDMISQSEYDANYHETENNLDFTGPTMDAEDIVWDNDVSVLLGKEDGIVNIMLIGQDRREGETRARSDSMILCTINKKTKTLTFTSFLRDLYVQIPGYRDNRINASYAIGGMKLLDATVEKNFGVHIDGNVEIDFAGFYKAIDSLGGLEIELTGDEAWYLNKRGNWDYNIASAGTWNLKKGVNLLTGEQLFAYSRIRDLDSDFGRTNRQRKVLSTLLESVKDMNVKELNKLLEQMLPLVTTDLGNSDIMGYAMAMFPMVSDMKINSVQIPADNAYSFAMIDGMSVIVPDLDANREVLKKAIGCVK